MTKHAGRKQQECQASSAHGGAASEHQAAQMPTSFIWLNDPVEAHTCEEHSEGHLNTQQECQTSSAHGGAASEHQDAQLEPDVFAHIHTGSADSSATAEQAAAKNQRTAETSASNNMTIGIWEVEFPKYWFEYDSEIQSIIEQRYQNGEQSASFQQCRSRKKNIWDDYIITFRNMTQRNVRSGRLQKVQRIERKVVA